MIVDDCGPETRRGGWVLRCSGGALAAEARQKYRRERTRCYSRGGDTGRGFGKRLGRVGVPQGRLVVIPLVLEARRPFERRPGARGFVGGAERGGEGEGGRGRGIAGEAVRARGLRRAAGQGVDRA